MLHKCTSSTPWIAQEKGVKEAAADSRDAAYAQRGTPPADKKQKDCAKEPGQPGKEIRVRMLGCMQASLHLHFRAAHGSMMTMQLLLWQVQAQAGRQVGEANKSQYDMCSISDFSQGPILGTGSFGRVLLAAHKQTGRVCAIKALSKAHLVKSQQACTTYPVPLLDWARLYPCKHAAAPSMLQACTASRPSWAAGMQSARG